MEKYAFEIVDEIIEKYARSYDALRKKQYWQMMKKMHGGTDEAVDNIIKNRVTDSLIGAPIFSNEFGFANSCSLFTFSASCATLFDSAC